MNDDRYDVVRISHEGVVGVPPDLFNAIAPPVPQFHGASISPWRASNESILAQVNELGSNLITFSIRAESTLTGSTVSIPASEYTWGGCNL